MALSLQGYLANGYASTQLRSWGGGVEQKLTEHTEAIADLRTLAAVANTTPLWVSDFEDMSSFPRSDLAVTVTTAGATRPKYADVLDASTITCGANAHNHFEHHGVCPVFKPGVTVGSTLGDIYYIPIICDRRGIPAAVRWIVGADTSFLSINYYEMALCGYNPANGNVEKVWGSGDIKDGDADTTSLQEVEVETLLGGAALDQESTPGQLLFIAHQQVAPSILQVARRFAVKALPGIGRPGLLHNAACYVAESHTQGIPSSISFDTLTRVNDYLPWASIRMTAVEE
ncbi:hypothetical protein [Mycolicibacterium palauense]|uniref:hypothetical protein n=1 Tax=Mycolicibacterium palauense TaxID=2034511 RepID=UPI0011453DDE|nr:hypothetical protein [Mycolicibacterium palauense]